MKLPGARFGVLGLCRVQCLKFRVHVACRIFPEFSWGTIGGLFFIRRVEAVSTGEVNIVVSQHWGIILIIGTPKEYP